MEHPTQPNLPTEIQTHIITLVHSDSRGSALACAVVCREWLFFSRRLSFSRRIRVSRPNAQVDESELLTLLKHPLGTLQQFLTRIALGPSFTGISSQILTTLTESEYGPPIQDFSISCLGSKVEEVLIPFVVKHDISLRVLEIRSISSTTSRVLQLLTAISGCSSLADLTLYVSGVEDKLAAATTPIPLPPPSLVRLTTTLFTPDFLEKWAFRASHVKNIQLDCWHPRDLSTLARTLCQSRIDILADHVTLRVKTESGDALDEFLSSSQCARQVASLTIDCRGDLQRYRQVNVNFSLAENLHDLKLRCSILGSEGFETVLSSIGSSLKTPPAHTHIDLIIHIRTDNYGTSADRAQAEKLDIALNSFVECMANARSIRVRIEDSRRGQSGAGRYPLCEARSTIASNFVLDTRAPR